MAALPTVKIKSPKGSGSLRINEGDFDPAKHQRWEEGEQKGTGQKEGEQKAPAVGAGPAQKKGG